MPPSQPYTFSEIIEADHQTIQSLARQTISRSTPHSTRLSLLPSLTAHLIRHDISEDLVMRPALARYLGAYGVQVAERDQSDHAELKGRLLALLDRDLEGLGEEGVCSELRALVGEMASHMEEEGGVVIPRLERTVGREVSVQLGREYLSTLVLTVDVLGEGGGKCFGGLNAYARAEVGVLRGIWKELEERCAREVDDGYLKRRVREETAVIGLGPDSEMAGDVVHGDGLGSKTKTRCGNGKL